MGCKPNLGEYPPFPVLVFPPFPTPAFPCSTPIPYLFPSPPLEVRPLIQLESLGEPCKFPSRVWGGTPAEIEFGAF